MKCLVWWLQLFLTLLLAGKSLSESPQNPGVCESSPDEKECRNESVDGGNLNNNVRVVTQEELESKTGENDSEIWLSVLGEVFDVTEGKSFYGKGMSYSGLSGKDCSLGYVTGIFTAEEAAKDTDEISDDMIPGVLEWLSFYKTHGSYKFVGYLVDPRFYDEHGEPTAKLIATRKRISLLNKSK